MNTGPALGHCSPTHTLQALPGLFHPYSSLGTEVAAQLHVQLQGNTRGQAGPHQQCWLLTQPLPPLWGERKGKKQMEAACELSIGSHCRSGTWGEKTESAGRKVPQKGGFCTEQEGACSPSVPCPGDVTGLQGTAAPGSGLAPPRPAAGSSSSSPGWHSCLEHKALQPRLPKESEQAPGWAGLWSSLHAEPPHTSLSRDDFCGEAVPKTGSGATCKLTPPGKESQPLTLYKTGRGGAEGTEGLWKQPHHNHQRTSHLNSLF